MESSKEISENIVETGSDYSDDYVVSKGSGSKVSKGKSKGVSEKEFGSDYSDDDDNSVPNNEAGKTDAKDEEAKGDAKDGAAKGEANQEAGAGKGDKVDIAKKVEQRLEGSADATTESNEYDGEDFDHYGKYGDGEYGESGSGDDTTESTDEGEDTTESSDGAAGTGEKGEGDDNTESSDGADGAGGEKYEGEDITEEGVSDDIDEGDNEKNY